MCHLLKRIAQTDARSRIEKRILLLSRTELPSCCQRHERRGGVEGGTGEDDTLGTFTQLTAPLLLHDLSHGWQTQKS